NLVQPVVKSVESRKDVAQDVDVGRGRDQRRVEIGDVLGNRKAERLVSCERLWRGCRVAVRVACADRDHDRDQPGPRAHLGKASGCRVTYGRPVSLRPMLPFCAATCDSSARDTSRLRKTDASRTPWIPAKLDPDHQTYEPLDPAGVAQLG